MAYLSLSKNDINVLEKIKDPEFDPTAIVPIDSSLSRDPHITDAALYNNIVTSEREILLSFQKLEMQLARLQPKTIADPAAWYREGVSKLEGIIREHPKYASARNNRAQALRRLYGDGLLLAGEGSDQALVPNPPFEDKSNAAKTILDDLDEAIRLLLPATPTTPISPQAAKTLSMSYTQRAAVYHSTVNRFLDTGALAVPSERRESGWTKMDFEQAAAGDFAMGGRYGSEVAKGLAVSVNPTAKLCGQMVVILQPVDNGKKPHQFGHAIVAGIERYPSRITRRMSKDRQDKRNKIKPFIKVINYNHLMPTRYTLELEGLKGVVSADTFKEVSQREDAKKTVKKVFEERYTSGKNRWFFTALTFPLSKWVGGVGLAC
ncbi:related to 60S large subunit ribosomal protein [Cephalotrichum gorgonifer]|uniref:Related to 60S large subunit ribosomal protein n=1 Tax=Cephalotrichum gorgonifer TaxID=2041049 RepID=A0AAE8N1U3_9PEZI|nr:related to 60S large subunit ribosomal protein [Cephalotrichum gorgonifer]